MASFCRSATRSFVSRSKPLLPRASSSKPSPSPFSSSTRSSSSSSRFVKVTGCVESMMPLHSAIASARLKSSIAANSTYWSWLSQGYELVFTHFVTGFFSIFMKEISLLGKDYACLNCEAL